MCTGEPSSWSCNLVWVECAFISLLFIATGLFPFQATHGNQTLLFIMHVGVLSLPSVPVKSSCPRSCYCSTWFDSVSSWFLTLPALQRSCLGLTLPAPLLSPLPAPLSSACFYHYCLCLPCIALPACDSDYWAVYYIDLCLSFIVCIPINDS